MQAAVSFFRNKLSDLLPGKRKSCHDIGGSALLASIAVATTLQVILVPSFPGDYPNKMRISCIVSSKAFNKQENLICE
jgi:hypothetical protein